MEAAAVEVDPRSEVYERLKKARRTFVNAQRAWVKTARTHFNGNKYSLYDEPSVVARCKLRLRQADVKIKVAEAKWVAISREWSLFNAYVKFEKMALTRPEFAAFKCRAAARLAAHYEAQKSSQDVVVSEFPSLKGPPSFEDVLAAHFGLAQTWALGELFC